MAMAAPWLAARFWAAWPATPFRATWIARTAVMRCAPMMTVSAARSAAVMNGNTARTGAISSPIANIIAGGAFAAILPRSSIAAAGNSIATERRAGAGTASGNSCDPAGKKRAALAAFGQASPVARRIGDINRRRHLQPRLFFGAKIAHRARRRAQDHLARAEYLVFRHQRAGPHQGARPDTGAVEQDRAHADQGAIADKRGMQNDAMADGDALADRHRLSGIGMNDAVILDIGARADGDPFIVAAQHRAEPDAGAGHQTDLSD